MPVTRYALYICLTYVIWQNMHIVLILSGYFLICSEGIFYVMVIEDLFSFQDTLIIALLHTKVCSCLGCILQFQCMTCDTTSNTHFCLIHVHELS